MFHVVSFIHGTSPLGSKFLDPFGLFGAYALRKRRDRLFERYGGAANVNGLGMFLVDFGVLNAGPLAMAHGGSDEDLERAEGDQRPLVLTVGVPEGVELQAVRHQENAHSYGAISRS